MPRRRHPALHRRRSRDASASTSSSSGSASGGDGEAPRACTPDRKGASPLGRPDRILVDVRVRVADAPEHFEVHLRFVRLGIAEHDGVRLGRGPARELSRAEDGERARGGGEDGRIVRGLALADEGLDRLRLRLVHLPRTLHEGVDAELAAERGAPGAELHDGGDDDLDVLRDEESCAVAGEVGVALPAGERRRDGRLPGRANRLEAGEDVRREEGARARHARHAQLGMLHEEELRRDARLELGRLEQLDAGAADDDDGVGRIGAEPKHVRVGRLLDVHDGGVGVEDVRCLHDQEVELRELLLRHHYPEIDSRHLLRKDGALRKGEDGLHARHVEQLLVRVVEEGVAQLVEVEAQRDALLDEHREVEGERVAHPVHVDPEQAALLDERHHAVLLPLGREVHEHPRRVEHRLVGIFDEPARSAEPQNLGLVTVVPERGGELREVVRRAIRQAVAIEEELVHKLRELERALVRAHSRHVRLELLGVHVCDELLRRFDPERAEVHGVRNGALHPSVAQLARLLLLLDEVAGPELGVMRLTPLGRNHGFAPEPHNLELGRLELAGNIARVLFAPLASVRLGRDAGVERSRLFDVLGMLRLALHLLFQDAVLEARNLRTALLQALIPLAQSLLRLRSFGLHLGEKFNLRLHGCNHRELLRNH
mmetsp:Transcript_23815/g.77428  ORF Transcript_23815/g.77428 Transcript_23815/m.77428 type:complete len:657 (+) Transcript_23815:257-2227(+)